MLSQVDEWAFDSFELARVTEGRPLSTLGFALIRRSGITAKLRLDEGKLARWGKEAKGTSRQSANERGGGEGLIGGTARGSVSIAVGLGILQGSMMLARLNLPHLPSLDDPQLPDLHRGRLPGQPLPFKAGCEGQ